jgi:hypothetical protein
VESGNWLGEAPEGEPASRSASKPVSLGYPSDAYRSINWHVGNRLVNHLRHHRSQRAYQLPQGVSCYARLQKLGLRFLDPKTRVCF